MLLAALLLLQRGRQVRQISTAQQSEYGQVLEQMTTCRQIQWRPCRVCNTVPISADRKTFQHATTFHKTLHDIGGAFHPPNPTVFNAAQAFTYFVSDLRGLDLSMIPRLHPSHGFSD